MHNSKPASTSKEAKTGQIIRIEQEGPIWGQVDYVVSRRDLGTG